MSTSNFVTRTEIKLEPDPTRVLIRPFIPSDERRVTKILARIAAQSDAEVQEHLEKIRADFASRHIEVESAFLKRYGDVKHLNFIDAEPSLPRRLLIGSYFTSEYSLESAALFNPSMVPHPDQTGLADGEVRFIMSLRAVGEGHISSVSFRSGVIDKQNRIKLAPSTRFVENPECIVDREFVKRDFFDKLAEEGYVNDYSEMVSLMLDDTFTLEDLRTAASRIHNQHPKLVSSHRITLEEMIALAHANYDVTFDPAIPLEGRVLFPVSPNEKNGIEDARFVRFTDDSGQTTWLGTATAWDGKTILPQLIQTDNFVTFQVRTLNGEGAANKGMAIFPRKINGKYAMISRQDNENVFLMYSDRLQFWRDAKLIMKPAWPWEFYQMGNSGSPIETDAGWLLLTHGVGAMRRYAIGAALLDKDDPSKVIGRSKEPFLVPNDNEREGYVPNVVYSCGAMLHGDSIVLPYAMADQATRVAIVNLPALLDTLTHGGN